MTDILFYGFATILLLSGLGVVTVRNPVHAVLSLVLAFFTAACLWMMLEAEFLAIILVLVYVGAVMVLFLFVVMMLDINIDRLREGFWKQAPLAVAVGALIAVELSLVLATRQFGVAMPEPHTSDYSNVTALGRVLYTDYVYPFELAAVILLVAMIAAIALTLRRRVGVKRTHPAEQVKVQRADRLRIVKMAAEKREPPV